jgi:hypothetical protein
MADFTFPAYVKGKQKRISKHAKALNQAILNTNPKKRPTIKKIKNCKWIKGRSESSSEDEFLADEVLESKEFSL